MLEREQEWIAASPKARQAKSKARIKAYDELIKANEERLKSTTAQIIIPPGERLGSNVIEVEACRKAYGDQLLDRRSVLQAAARRHRRHHRAERRRQDDAVPHADRPGEARLGRRSRIGESVQLGYVDQSRDSLDPDKTVWQEISGGNDVLYLGKREMNSRAYTGAFNFKGGDQQQKVGTLSGGQRNRVHLAKMLKSGANVLLLDEPTNDLDTETLAALEEALEDFAGCAVIISHDRMFLDRLATHILAFEGDSHVEWFEGNFQDYEEDKKRRLGEDSVMPKRIKYKQFAR